MVNSNDLNEIDFFKNVLKNVSVEYVIDPLTKIISRKYILEYINYLIDNNIPFGLVILDLDNFKEINDNYGHLVGDKILSLLGNSLLSYCQRDALVGRYGGDEFLMVHTKATTYEGLYNFLYDMYGSNSVLRQNLSIDNHRIYVTGTMGAASFPNDASTYKELFLNADKALYRGKIKGRNCFLVYQESKHKDININNIVRRPLHEILSTINNIFFGYNTFENKIVNSFYSICKDLNMTNAIFISLNGYIYSNSKIDCSKIEKKNINHILGEGDLFYSNNLKYVFDKSEDLWMFMQDNHILSILLTPVKFNNIMIGYIIFTENSIERLWQDDDFALIINLKQLISSRHDAIKFLPLDEFIKESDKVLYNSLFDGLANTSNKRFMYISNLETGNTRWCKNSVDYFNLESEIFPDAIEKWAMKIHPQDRQRFLDDINEVFTGKKDEHNIEYRAMNKYGEYVVITCHGRIVREVDKTQIIFIGTLDNHGIADYIDPITNLYNIYKFNELYDKKEYGNLNIILLGLVKFSDINALYGYTVGDSVLKEIAGILLTYKSENVNVFKMDGVRFSLVIKEKNKDEIEKLYNEIKEKLLNIEVNGFKINLNLAAGMVLKCEKYDKRDVLASLNSALFKSKYELNGDLVLFNYDSLGVNEKNIKLMAELRDSLVNNYKGFDMSYQPVFDAKCEKIIGAEALLRWVSPTIGNVSPQTFIPWLEEDSYFYDFGKWILKTSLESMLPMVKKNPDFMLNVNISYTQIQKADFVQSLLSILKLVEYPAKNLCLEITERCRYLDMTFLKNTIDILRNNGIRIAIDDFGTGFSSLDILINLPVDMIKIDRSFILNLNTNPINKEVVEAVINCANNLDILVCVEGVEDRNLIEILKKYNPSCFQGYYYSKPLYIEEFKEKYNK